MKSYRFFLSRVDAGERPIHVQGTLSVTFSVPKVVLYSRRRENPSYSLHKWRHVFHVDDSSCRKSFHRRQMIVVRECPPRRRRCSMPHTIVCGSFLMGSLCILSVTFLFRTKLFGTCIATLLFKSRSMGVNAISAMIKWSFSWQSTYFSSRNHFSGPSIFWRSVVS